MSPPIRVGLVGNPNVGKTTLFNALTGARQHVGNWPGVTVEKKSGDLVHAGVAIEVIDLPGVYSLQAYSVDESITRDVLLDEPPDVVVQVVDATNLERNLYLTTQLAELGLHLVLAVTMADLAEAEGTCLDYRRFSEVFGLSAIRTVGSTGEGLTELLDEVVATAGTKPVQPNPIDYPPASEAAIAGLVELLEERPDGSRPYPPSRWTALRLLEGDEHVLDSLVGNPAGPAVRERLADTDTLVNEALFADLRYTAIADRLPLVHTACPRKSRPSDLVDRVVTDRFLGIPIFLALMWAAFELTFAVSAPLSSLVELVFGRLGELVRDTTQDPWLASLVGDGIIGGVGSVLVFVPSIFVLLLVLSVLEDSGYMARAAFIMDRLMQAIGLPGKSFIPMLLGFGCNVAGIMATRTIEDRKDRLVAILLNPFISCGARLPVFVLFAGVFFPAHAGTVVFCLYLLGIAVAIGSAILLRSTVLPGSSAPFIMEMPPYRFPGIRTALLHGWSRASVYLQKATGIILAGSLAVWFLASFPAGVEYGSEASLAGLVGHAIAPLVAPLGFDWRMAVALVSGFVAKEIVIGSLGVLYGAGDNTGAIAGALAADPSLSAPAALSLMVFVLLYTPCLATLATIRKETGSWGWTGFSVVHGLAVAWVLSFIVYRFGRLVAGGA